MLSPQRTKILVCAYSCISESGVEHPGGEAELGWNVVKQLSRFYDVSVLTHAYNEKAITAVLQKEPLSHVHFYYIRLPQYFSFLENFHGGGIQIYAYLWQIKAYFFAKKLHRQHPVDLFHHVTYANDWMASFIGALLPVPYIRGPGGGAHRIPSAFKENYSLKEKFSEQLRSVGQWLFRHDPFFIKGQKRAKALLVCNREALNALPRPWKNKARLFPVNGISNKDIIDQKLNTSDTFTVITAGKLIKLKRIDLALKAFKLFHDNFPDSKFIIVGEGPEFKNLKKLTEDFNLQDSVVFHPWINRKELLKKISEADVFVFPSLRDGGGAVVVEAMAAGKPVICFDIAGPGFHISDQWGIKIKPENPTQAVRDIAEAMKMLYDNENLKARLGMAAKKRAKEFYSWDRLGDILHDIYKETHDNIH